METKQIILPEDRVKPLSEAQLEAVKPNRGRRAVPSRYLEQVREAAENPGTAYGIQIYPGYDLSPTQIITELRKAEKQVGVKLQKWDKSKEENPFIGFKVKEAEVKPAEATPDAA